jgi:hypothetical protein
MKKKNGATQIREGEKAKELSEPGSRAKSTPTCFRQIRIGIWMSNTIPGPEEKKTGKKA